MIDNNLELSRENKMNLEPLRTIGLTEGEIAIYQVLLEHGEIPASKLIEFSGLKRGDCYNKIYALINKGLAEETIKKGKKHFRLEPPQAIEEYISRKSQEILSTKKEVSAILPEITSLYNLSTHKPGVSFFEGVEGLKKAYNNILDEVEEGGDFDLVRAKYEKVYQQEIVPQVVNQFIKQRVKREIRVKMMTPYEEQGKTYESRDKELLVDRQWVSPNDYNAPVEIDVYKNKIALLSFKKELLGVVIESPQIAQAIKQILDLAREGAKSRLEKNDQNQTL